MSSEDGMGLDSIDLLSVLQVERSDMVLHMLDNDGNYCKSWEIYGAYAINWDLSDALASSNEVLMETLEFEYSELTET